MEKPTVIELMDHHDERFMLETVQDLACKDGHGAHVYAAPMCAECEESPTFIISATPLTPEEIAEAVKQDEEEWAMEEEIEQAMEPFEKEWHLKVNEFEQLKRQHEAERARKWKELEQERADKREEVKQAIERERKQEDPCQQ